MFQFFFLFLDFVHWTVLLIHIELSCIKANTVPLVLSISSCYYFLYLFQSKPCMIFVLTDLPFIEGLDCGISL